ncbi:hypothetical protein CDAR_285191 [Caerostris darwini]|uniref:Uncharacterized protein n=1 Tax=Caerostris darwini TaxID=1538125 RepID=A0AAV4X5Z0_9ARAC|nr:hypothetical protein CDAR_285191 [Caerostris darwini]
MTVKTLKAVSACEAGGWSGVVERGWSGQGTDRKRQNKALSTIIVSYERDVCTMGFPLETFLSPSTLHIPRPGIFLASSEFCFKLKSDDSEDPQSSFRVRSRGCRGWSGQGTDRKRQNKALSTIIVSSERDVCTMEHCCQEQNAPC